jgi:hypothetical protein
MATKSKDAKAKTKTLEGAKKTQAKAKEELKAANAALTTFLKKNKLARDEDHSKDKKFGKEFKELTLAVGKANEAMDAANAAVDKFKGSEKKESKGGSGRATKYDYPEGLTSKEKKEYRIKMRKEANGGTSKAKSDKKSEKGKDKKSDKKTKNLAPVEKTTTTKKSKKKDKGSKKKSKKDND